MEIITLQKRLQDFCNHEAVINRLIDVFKDNANLYLVGGAVRSVLLGQDPADIDLTTNIPINEAISLIENHGIRIIPTGLKHDTISVLFPDELKAVELTALRLGSCTIHEDLGLRDFTINAIAYSIFENHIIDPFNGLLDIEHKQIVCVQNAFDRLHEDPLRIMRLVRFCCTLGFSVSQSTFESAKTLAPHLSSIATERIRDELSKILLSHNPSMGFKLLYDLQSLQIILPEIHEFYGFEQNEFHKADLFHHTLEILQQTPPDLILRLAALLHDVGKPAALSIDSAGFRHFYRHENIGAKIAKKILERLKYPNQIINAVTLLVATHMRPIDAGSGGLRRLLRDTGEHFERWRALKEADTLACKVDSEKIAQNLREFDDRIQDLYQEQEKCNLNQLAINGYDLIKLGIKPGPDMGRIIKALKEHILDNPKDNTKDKLISVIKDFI